MFHDMPPTTFRICKIMMTSSNGNIFRVTVTRNFDVFFDLHPKERLSKQWWGWWCETLSCPSWRHRNVTENCISDPACKMKLTCFNTLAASSCFRGCVNAFRQNTVYSVQCVICPLMARGTHWRWTAGPCILRATGGREWNMFWSQSEK